MRSSIALTLMALAGPASAISQADELFPAAYRASGTPSTPGNACATPPASSRPGLSGRLRKATEPEIPMSPPRLPAVTSPAAGSAASSKAARPAPSAETAVRKVQATPTDLGAAIIPRAAAPDASQVGSSLSLQQALTGALTSNPDLLTLRNGNQATASAEAVEVARTSPRST